MTRTAPRTLIESPPISAVGPAIIGVPEGCISLLLRYQAKRPVTSLNFLGWLLSSTPLLHFHFPLLLLSVSLHPPPPHRHSALSCLSVESRELSAPKIAAAAREGTLMKVLPQRCMSWCTPAQNVCRSNAGVLWTLPADLGSEVGSSHSPTHTQPSTLLSIYASTIHEPLMHLFIHPTHTPIYLCLLSSLPES